MLRFTNPRDIYRANERKISSETPCPGISEGSTNQSGRSQTRRRSPRCEASPRGTSTHQTPLATPGTRHPCHARGERRTEHDLLRHDGSNLRRRFLPAIHPPDIRHGLCCPGDDCSIRSGHQERTCGTDQRTIWEILGMVCHG